MINGKLYRVRWDSLSQIQTESCLPGWDLSLPNTFSKEALDEEMLDEVVESICC